MLDHTDVSNALNKMMSTHQIVQTALSVYVVIANVPAKVVNTSDQYGVAAKKCEKTSAPEQMYVAYDYKDN